jgi:RNA polymerase subunit RPABC4/transcription elongation factor Spt4
MPGFKHPCRYCNHLIPPDSGTCPYCGKVHPLESPRCPKCRSLIETGWLKCATCGASLRVNCPKCGKDTFFGDYCDACQALLVMTCPNTKCKTEQPIGVKCIKCGKPLT